MEKVSRYRKMILALMVCAAIVLGAGIATLATSSQSALGTPFPSNFSADQVQSDYTISTAEELVNFAAASGSFDFAGVTIHLISDIDYSDGYGDVSFSGIGSVTTPFCGTFDGHGYTLRNLYSTTTGLFNVIGSTESPAVIRDLTVDGASIAGAEGRAVLVCRFQGNPQDAANNNLIENVTVSNSTASFTGSNCGILVGRCQADEQAITISGCSVTDCDLICTASSATNVARWGMVMGKDVSLGYSRILNCTVTGSDILSTGCNLDRTGLVLGCAIGATQIDGCTVKTSSITSGLVSATVTQELGGIVGCLQSGYGSITNCQVGTTTITTKGLCSYVGLLAGRIYGGTVENCAVSSARILGAYEDASAQAEYLGGMIGGIDNNKAAIGGCKVSRVIINAASRVSFAGGLVGGVGEGAAGTSLQDSSIANSYITSSYQATSLYSTGVGGAVGSAVGKISADSVDVVNVNLSTASLVQDLGGFAGYLGGTESAGLSGCSVILSSLGAAAEGESPSARIGGLIGSVSGTAARVSDCRVESTTLSNASLVESMGGLIGNIAASSAGTVVSDCAVTSLTMENTYPTNCANSRYIGGVLGSSFGNVHLTGVELDDSSITVASLVQAMGGMAGYITGTQPSVLSECQVNGVTIAQNQTALDDSYMCYHLSLFLGCVDSDSKLAGCAVTNTSLTTQGRICYLGGLVGATYSDVISASPANGAITAKNCAVSDSALTTRQSRNCNESGGLIGWLSEGGTVTNCHVSGYTAPSNTNGVHVGGLIGYMAESTTEAVNTTVKSCYVQDCTLSGRISLSATVGNAVASGKVFANNYYSSCTLNGGTESNVSGALEATSGLTDGTLVTNLNTTGAGNWIQGAASPVLNPDRKGYTEVKVMCYNIYYLTQNDSYPIADRQAKVIDLIDSSYSSGVGVFGLQEVSAIWYDYISDYVKNENTNLSWCGYGRYGGTFGGFANGVNDSGDAFSLILYDTTRYSKTGEGHFWLSETPGEKSLFYTVAFNYRVVNWVRLRDKTTGEEFIFVNAHLEQTQSTPVVNGWGYTLDASSGTTARIQQAQLICDQMEACSDGLPVILLGDWNSYAGTDGYSTIISNGYQDLREISIGADQYGAYNAWTRMDRSKYAKGDHIVASELCTGVSFDVLDQEDLDAATGYHISDHSPLIAVIRY